MADAIVGQMNSQVHVVDAESLLTDELVDRIAARVMERMRDAELRAQSSESDRALQRNISGGRPGL